MILLLHGDDTTTSRNRLNELRDKHQGEVLGFDLKDSPAENIQSVLVGDSLFSLERLIIIENFFEQKKAFSIERLPKDEHIIYWESKKLTQSQLTAFQKENPKATVEEFKLSPVVFKFLDGLSPGNQKALLLLWRDYVLTEQPEVAFSMIIRQFRLLLLAKTGATDAPDDYKRLSPWQLSRLQSQAKNFDLPALKQIFGSLLALDHKNKTGQLPVDLQTSIELFLPSL